MDDVKRAVANMFCVGFEGRETTAELRESISRGVSSVVLFTRNYESPAQFAELCLEIKSCTDRPIMICIDQEGGRVQRLREPFTILPSMREVGRRDEIEFILRIGRVMARELRAVNIDMNLAPVLDVDSNPKNPVIGERSFGNDPALVARMGCALIEALQASGMAACGKHFPGHGDTDIDSHLDLPRLSHGMDRLDRIELPPFRAAIAAGVAAIMSSHVLFEAVDPKYPVTMSAAVIGGLLRDQLQFEGVVISDDMEMKAIIDHYGIEHAVVRGAIAGIDLFCVSKTPELQHQALEALITAVQRGSVPVAQVEQANRRLRRLFDRFVRPASKWTQRSAELFGEHVLAPSRR